MMTHISETKYWNKLMHDVFGPREGGAIVVIDAENARKGVAKTSCAVANARLTSRVFDYDLQKDDLLLSGKEILKRYRKHPTDEPSVIVWDEAVGAGSGDARRAMSEDNVELSRAWQLMRTKQILTFVTLPDWNELDTRLQKLADYRLWCKEQPIGTFKPYKITTPFNTNSQSEVKTKGLGKGIEGARRIQFPNLDAENDPFYRHISRKKGQLLQSGTFDADQLAADGGEEEDPDEARRKEMIKTAIRAVEKNGLTYNEAAKLIDNGETWVGNRVREYRDGEHQELVGDDL